MREVPFEQTMAAVFPPTISADDIRSYVNANLSRLNALLNARSISVKPKSDRSRHSVSKDEVIDETIAAALGDGQEKPEKTCARAVALSPGAASARRALAYR